MAIHALSLATTREYISRLDPHHPDRKRADPAQATRWKLGTLDSRVYGYLRDSATEVAAASDGTPVQRVNAHRMHRESVRFGLRGWSGFKDANGKEIAFETEETSLGGKIYTVVAARLLDLMPGEVIVELGREIRAKNELEEDEAKNSETPS